MSSSVQAHLRRLAASFHRDVAITLVDKRLGWKFDLCNTKVRQRYLDLVDQGYFDMVLCRRLVLLSPGRPGLISRARGR